MILECLENDTVLAPFPAFMLHPALMSHRLFLCDSSLYIGVTPDVVGLLHLVRGNVNSLMVLARSRLNMIVLLLLF
jgi:hypothetical protein